MKSSNLVHNFHYVHLHKDTILTKPGQDFFLGIVQEILAVKSTFFFEYLRCFVLFCFAALTFNVEIEHISSLGLDDNICNRSIRVSVLFCSFKI
jgi:hypothetical protein